MNDFGEMHWPYLRFVEAGRQIAKTVGKEFLEEIDHIISSAQTRILPLISSFSTDGDVLSQWRAYANDGTGVSIGFDSNLIKSLSVQIGSVEYDETKQIEIMKSTLEWMFLISSNMKGEERDSFIFQQSAILGIDMTFFKNPGFMEEKEVRIIRAVNPKVKDDMWTLSDPGGSGEKLSRKKIPIQYRAGRSGGLIAYIALPLLGLGSKAIKEIVIGPKSDNNGVEISMALTAFGFSDFKTRHSRATYR
ncbi:DUF2971 domain-containing protein [Bosea sp. Tri-44]|uniref:DUF2971 domain-containing protein n=1 Tax=Bosea sp. Tri-44 TaxID=1972137 RepID=UPI0013E913EA|nr:DUF2971 domain-containing protein [Bosea sp. Tri-44]